MVKRYNALYTYVNTYFYSHGELSRYNYKLNHHYYEVKKKKNAYQSRVYTLAGKIGARNGLDKGTITELKRIAHRLADAQFNKAFMGIDAN